MDGSWEAQGLPDPSAAPGPPGGAATGLLSGPADLPPDVGLPVAAVAQRLGVAPATLRTWARRYGLGPTSHVAGSHRRYGGDDLRRLVVMRRLTMEGVAPADAARAALASAGDVVPSSSDRSDDIRSARPPAPDGRRATSRPVRPRARPAPGDDRGRAAQPPWGQEADRAAVALDPEQTQRTVVAAFDGLGLLEGWDQVVGPSLLALARAWETTGPGYDSELILTSSVLAALRSRTTPPPATERTVLLAPAEDERDALVLHVVAAALGERGVSSHVLAPGRPREALAAAVRSKTPAGVLVLAASPVRGSGQLAVLDPLPAGTCLVLVGAGWRSDAPDVAGRSRVVRSLVEAVDVLAGCALHGPGAC